MFSNPVVGVVISGLALVVIVVILYNAPQAKAARARRAEEEKKRYEEYQQRERELAEGRKKQWEKLRKYQLIVFVREKDGRRCAFEANLISALVEQRVTIIPVPQETMLAIASGDASLLEEGQLALVGTFWERAEHRVATDEMGSDCGTYLHREIFCDFRLISRGSDGKGRIVAAGSRSTWPSSCASGLASDIVGGLASAVSLLRDDLE